MKSSRWFLSRQVGKFGWLMLVIAMVALSGCGAAIPGATGPTAVPTEAPTSEPPTSEPPTVEPTPEPARGLGSLTDAQQAVIQIEAQGTFVSPDEGMLFNLAGRGSGFIIDESGIAVTNNHVVTGAALLKVFVNGESRPRNARVLGVSECSDLAVIDIEGEGFPYLDWYDGDLQVGLDVFAAGYPLGDPEFTLTRGIISKARTDGETSWASVDNVLEHDATINQGNSGGPLLSESGLAIGVNYAGRSDTNQYFAISRDEALPLIEKMRNGEDVTSIGINGEAFSNGFDSGIWVWSVKSGSPADNAGVKPGDIITKLERLVLATDGTMTDYCDILRSRNPSDTLAIEVFRSDTQQVLEGQINGRELEETFSFARDENIPGVQDGGSATYDGYEQITDANELLIVEVPTSWSDVSSGTWNFAGRELERSVGMTAAPNIDAFINTWDSPGVFIGASQQLAQEMNVTDLLDQNAFSQSCTYEGRDDYSDGLYTGFFDTWTNCGGTDTVLIVVGFEPEDGSFLGLVQVQVVTEADLEALDRILDTFIVVGEL
ncbi:serine protease [Candidatus Chloroploca sp. M-50]|uniref:Serine protease n=1 Tax=Candidatus Chloroploca mongolica TaxID=2528176 RepID=A0ABS4D784_9CHLR|nr:S1C family serine protease [Candidatus Chloroploca mongolica]MBP1465302.1 serine protease [Candidatus Chloroploca mongolica]